MMTWQMLVAGFFVLLGGYCFGAILGTLFCRPKEQVSTENDNLYTLFIFPLS